MTRDQMGTCMRLAAEGLIQISMPYHPCDTPIPGLILFTDVGHTKLLMVHGDGSTVDLLEVHRLAEDLVRNWRKGASRAIPQFVGDFARLTPLAIALNGTPAMTETERRYQADPDHFMRFCHGMHYGAEIEARRDKRPFCPLPHLCEDCPSTGYPTDEARCTPCPRRNIPNSLDPAGVLKEDGT